MEIRVRIPTLLCLLLVVAVAVPLPTAGTAESAGDEYDISIANSVDTPSRTVTFQDKDHEVSAVAVADPGESVSVDVTAPEGSYRVYIYNGDEQIEASKRGEGDGSYSFDLSNYDAGTYLVTVYQDGNYEAIHPVVVRGYDVSVDHPSSVTAGNDIDVDVELTQTADVATPDSVEIAVADEQDEVNVTATRESGTTYVATVPTDDLATGNYDVYAGVRIDETAFGERAIVGVSGASAVEITDPEPTTTSAPSTTRTTTTQSTTTATQTTSENQTTSTTLTTTATAPETATATPTETTQATTARTDETATTTTDDGVLTPNATTTNASASTGQPGVGPAGAVLAVVAAAVLAVRRRY